MSILNFKVEALHLESLTHDSTTFGIVGEDTIPSQARKRKIICDLLKNTDHIEFSGEQDDLVFGEGDKKYRLISLSRVEEHEARRALNFVYFPDDILEIIENFARKNTKTHKKGEIKMLNNKFGEKITGIFGVSMFDGKPSYKLGDKWVSFDGEKLVDTTEFTMDLDIPSIALPVMINQIQPNDLIVHEDGFVIVKSVENGSVRALTSSGVELTITPMTNPMMGGAFLTKVVNPMNMGMAMGGQDSTNNPMMGGMMNGMNPMLMMAMSKDSGDDSMFKTMMMMQMMQQNQNPENK